MLRDWKNILSNRASEWALPPGDEWNCLFHNNYQPICSSFNVLWFYRNERFPRAVAKMCREQAVLTREFRNLKAIYALTPDCVPRPLDLVCAGPFWILWMTGVPGRRIPPRRHYAASMLIPPVDMLVSIHRAVKKEPDTANADRHSRMVTTPLDAVIHYGPSAAVRDGCAKLAEAVPAPWINALPVVPQHGDLFLDNVLRDRDTCRVVDWETFGEIDLPFYDLLTLLLSFLRASGETPELWDAKLASRISTLIYRYACALQLPASLVSALLPLTLANWFYLHWAEGRKASAARMYAAIQHYFEHRNSWDGVFLEKEGRRS